MDKAILNATKRTVTGRKVKKLRLEGVTPANLFGKKIKSQSIQVIQKEFQQIYSKVKETGLVDLVIDKTVHPVLINHASFHSVTNAPLHIDFFQVDLKEKVTTKVPLAFVGESPAVKDKLGVLLHILSDIEIEALPADLPEKLEVDIKNLKKVGDTLKVSDVSVSDKIKILSDRALELVKVAPLVSKEAEQMAKEEAEAKAAAAAASAATLAQTPSTEGQSAVASTPQAQSPTPEAKKE